MHVGHSQLYVPAHAVLPLTLQIKLMVPFVYGGFKGIKALHSHQAELKLFQPPGLPVVNRCAQNPWN